MLESSVKTVSVYITKNYNILSHIVHIKMYTKYVK